MAKDYTYTKPELSDIVRGLVGNVQDKLQVSVLEPKGLNGIHFEDDTWAKLMNKLSSMNKVAQMKNVKYPLVALIRSFELKNDGKSKNYTTSIDLLIANLCDPNWYGDERRENNFTPILTPIYAQLMDEFSDSGHFLGYKDGHYPHTVVDDYHMSEQSEKYKLPDYLDAIIIKGLQLTVKPNFINCTNLI